MPSGQRIAHVSPKRRRRIRDLRGEFLVGSGDVLPKVKNVAVKRLLLHIEVFDDRDEFVAPIAVPAR